MCDGGGGGDGGGDGRRRRAAATGDGTCSVSHNDNGDIADDQYHRFKEDIKLVADMGLTSYR
jgi:beta-glucosidase/6-phospho-beta-glucosidase/beta-galactosidase